MTPTPEDFKRDVERDLCHFAESYCGSPFASEAGPAWIRMCLHERKRREKLEKEIAEAFDAIFPYVPEARANPHGPELTIADKIKLLTEQLTELEKKVLLLSPFIARGVLPCPVESSTKYWSDHYPNGGPGICTGCGRSFAAHIRPESIPAACRRPV